MPDSNCYNEALVLAEEIRSRVNSDIEYLRDIERRDSAYEHEAEMASVKAWKDVGVAFGNNQKANTYNKEIFVR